MFFNLSELVNSNSEMTLNCINEMTYLFEIVAKRIKDEYLLDMLRDKNNHTYMGAFMHCLI